MAAEKKSSADKEQENNDYAFPKTVHSGPDQSILSYLFFILKRPTLLRAPIKNGPPK